MLDGFGNVLWERTFQSGAYTQLNGLDLGPDGDILIAGQGNPSGQPWGFFAARTDGWGTESCAASGACSSFPPSSCPSAGPCQAPTCDPVTGCGQSTLPNGSRCDDLLGTCQGGACVP
jgi:hypothetical protein